MTPTPSLFSMPPGTPSLFSAPPGTPSLFSTPVATGGQPAVNMSPLTPIKGFFTGLGEMAQGLTALGAAAVHDVIGGVQELIPGEQAIEKEGYRLAAIGRAFFPSMASDYAKRYGGLSNIARGLWEDPLSYISDALLVGGAVGIAAKFGHVGAVLEKLPALMSESTAAKVLGAGAETAWRGQLQMANASLAKGVVETMPLSRNPATRFLQLKATNAFSLPVSSTKGEFFAKMSDPEIVRATQAIEYASTNGIRIMRPSVGRVMAGRRTSYALSKLHVDVQDTGAEEIARIQAVLDTADDPLRAAQMSRGYDMSAAMGKFDPVPVGAEGQLPTSNLPNATRLGPNASVEAPDPMIPGLQNVQLYPDRPALIEAGPGTDISYKIGEEFGPGGWELTNINTPHSPRQTLAHDDPLIAGHSHAYTVFTDSMDNAPLVAQRTMKAAELRPIGAHPYLMDDSVAYDGYHVIAQGPDGAIVDISVATRELYDAQKANSVFMDYAGQLENHRVSLIDNLAAEAAKGAAAKTETSVRISDELNALKYEVQATDAAARQSFRRSRLGYWADHGTDVDPDLLAAEGLAPVVFDTITKRFLHPSGVTTKRLNSVTGEEIVTLKGGMGTVMERAYFEQRYAKFRGMLADSRETFKDIFSGAVGPRGGKKMDVTDALSKNLLDSGIPAPLVNELIGSKRWWSGGDTAMVAKRADAFAKRMRVTLYDYMVKEGGRGAEMGFPAFDWRVMMKDRLDTGMPLPLYFPHFPDAKPSVALVASSRARGLVPREPGIFKGTTGSLLDQAKVLDDPSEAYALAARQVVLHEESSQALADLMPQVGRELSPAEAAAWVPNGGEVMVPLEQVQAQLSLRAEILADSLDALSQGDDLTTSILKAVEIFQERAMTEGINAIGGSRVYAVSRAVMKQFEKDLKIRFGHAMRVWYDGPMNLWKGSVLSLSPRWTLNNLFGNQFFMAVENPGALRLGIEQMSNKSEAYTTKQLLGTLGTENARGFFSDAQRMESVIPKDATGVLGAAKRIRDNSVAQAVGSLGHMNRRLNQFVEQADRAGVLINEIQRVTFPGWVQGLHSSRQIMERMLSEGKFTPELMAQALKGVNKTLGDYTRFGVYEQGILKRLIMPFWAFYRHAAKVLIRLPFEHPLKAAVLDQINDIDQQMNVGMPDWMRSRFRLTDFGGDDLMLNVQNLNPLSQFSEQFTQGQSIIGLLNPIAKMVLERELGIDTYTGEPFRIDEKNIIRTWDGSVYEMQYDTQGHYIGTKLLTGDPVPGLAQHLLSQFPQLQLFSSFQRYPKNVLLQIASMVGIPLSQIDMEGTIQRQAEAQASAETTAQNRLAEAGNPFDAVA